MLSNTGTPIGLALWRRIATGPRLRYITWRNRSAMRSARVVFTASDREVARMDIRLGPCAPLPGRKKPLAGRFSQLWPEDPRYIESLYLALGGKVPGEAWSSTRSVAPGRLFTVSDEFVALLAHVDAARAAATTDEARSQVLEGVADKCRLKLGARDWHRQRAWLDVLEIAWVASRAVRKRQKLYAWFGPGLSLWSAEKIQRVAQQIATQQPRSAARDIR